MKKFGKSIKKDSFLQSVGNQNFMITNVKDKENINNDLFKKYFGFDKP